MCVCVRVHERVLKQVCIYFLLHDFRVSDDSPPPDSLRELTPAGLRVFTHESLASSDVPTGGIKKKKKEKKMEGPRRIVTPDSGCSRGALAEPLNGCLAFYSVLKQSSWSGRHSKQEHFSEHIHISPALSPGEPAARKEVGR